MLDGGSDILLGHASIPETFGVRGESLWFSTAPNGTSGVVRCQESPVRAIWAIAQPKTAWSVFPDEAESLLHADSIAILSKHDGTKCEMR